MRKYIRFIVLFSILLTKNKLVGQLQTFNFNTAPNAGPWQVNNGSLWVDPVGITGANNTCSNSCGTLLLAYCGAAWPGTPV